MNKLQLANHFGITRQRLHELIARGSIIQNEHGEWVRLPSAPHGRPPKRRESYPVIAEQLHYDRETIRAADRQGRLIDTGEGWQMIPSRRGGGRPRQRESIKAIAAQLGVSWQRAYRASIAGRLIDTGEGWQMIELSSKSIDCQVD